MTTIGSLFTGYGGLDLAVEQVTGGRTVWTSDIDPGACAVIRHRFTAPNLGDISAVDWSTVEPVDIITGGFPCQDVSMAGRRAGMRPGNRSGLWSVMCRAIDELRPQLAVIENVRGLLSADGHADVEPCPWCLGDAGGEPLLRALGGVLGDLADIGYDAAWKGLRASDVGAPHGRFRVFITAWPTPDAGGEAIGLRAGLRQGNPPGVRWGRPDDDATQAANTHGAGSQGTQPAGRPNLPDGGVTANTDRDGLGAVRRVHTGQRDPDGCSGQDGDGNETRPSTQWGQFGPAVRRWESLTRPAPAPTEKGPKGGDRLSPRFVEWMMGLPAGWVTDVPGLTRNQQLKALGNGVVPQQAAAALGDLLEVTR